MQDIIEADLEASPVVWLREPMGQDETFIEFLGQIERQPVLRDRMAVIARYRAWIARQRGGSPALHAAWFNLGVVISASGDRSAAIEAYRQALLLRPDCHAAAHNLGLCLEATGQVEAALAVWQGGLQPEQDRTTLRALRHRLTEAEATSRHSPALLLRIGSGDDGAERLPAGFAHPKWRQVRLNSDPDTLPDVVAPITNMSSLADAAMDAVLVGQAIQHLHGHEVVQALREIRRVLKSTGVAVITVTDLQAVAALIVKEGLTAPLSRAAARPVTALDLLYGNGAASADGYHAASYRTGFTGPCLGAALIEAGFAAALVQRDATLFSLTVVALPMAPDGERLVQVQTELLPASGQPAILYRPADAASSGAVRPC